MTDNRTNEPTRAQVEAAARKWIERLDSDAHWARSPGAREKASSEKKILEWLLEAAAGAAPQAESVERANLIGRLTGSVNPLSVTCGECGSRPGRRCYGNGEMRRPHPSRETKAERELMIEAAEALAAPVQPSSTVNEAALIREAKAEALEEFAGQMATGFNPQTLNAERRAIKREARARAAEYREGSET